jgi:hypothetical protein
MSIVLQGLKNVMVDSSIVPRIDNFASTRNEAETGVPITVTAKNSSNLDNLEDCFGKAESVMVSATDKAAGQKGRVAVSAKEGVAIAEVLGILVRDPVELEEPDSSVSDVIEEVIEDCDNS